MTSAQRAHLLQQLLVGPWVRQHQVPPAAQQLPRQAAEFVGDALPHAALDFGEPALLGGRTDGARVRVRKMIRRTMVMVIMMTMVMMMRRRRERGEVVHIKVSVAPAEVAIATAEAAAALPLQATRTQPGYGEDGAKQYTRATLAQG